MKKIPQAPDFKVDTTKPPDGVPALQDDSGEAGEVDGVHLQPLVPVPVHGAPSPVVHVPVFNARLKRQVAEKGLVGSCVVIDLTTDPA